MSVGDLERLGDEIAELAAHLHAATYRLLVCLREFDAREGWSGGFRSCAHWLSWRTGIGLGPAREKVRVARALERLPLLSEAMRRGELSFAKVRAATRVGTPENEAQLLELAREGTASHVEKVVRAWRRVDRLEEQSAERERHYGRELMLYVDDGGKYVVRGRLDPEVGALLEQALAAAGEALYGRRDSADPRDPVPGAGARNGEPIREERVTADQRRADAIGLVAECALKQLRGSHQAHPTAVGADAEARSAMLHGESSAGSSLCRPDPDRAVTSDSRRRRHRFSNGSGTVRADAGSKMTRGDRFQVVVHVDAEALQESSDTGQSVLAGTRIAAETSRRLSCDASRVVMAHDADGTVLDVGRCTRTVPPAIRRALEHRDRGCRFPGCGLRYCDAHHIVHWADGGVTRLDNLALLCRRHHRVVHEDGFSMTLTAGGGIRFYRPDGRELPEVPQAPRLPEDPVAGLAATHRQSGLEIDASTAMSRWAGERLDLDFAVIALRGP